MYGTRETLCQLLNEQYPADTPLALIVWSPADIEALAEGMEFSVTDQEIRAVLKRIEAMPEEEHLESGVSAGAVMTFISQMKEALQNVIVPADLLESILTTAEQALWCREWTARDEGWLVPDSVIRRLSDAQKVRALLKK